MTDHPRDPSAQVQSDPPPHDATSTPVPSGHAPVTASIPQASHEAGPHQADAHHAGTHHAGTHHAGPHHAGPHHAAAPAPHPDPAAPHPPPDIRVVAPTDPEIPAYHTGTTLVVEEGVFRSRLRRPRDLVGALLAVLGALAVVGLAIGAQATTVGIDDDLAQAQEWLPQLIWGALSLIAGLGMVLLPLATAISMMVRHRGRQLLESFLAMTIAAIVLTLFSTLIRIQNLDTLYQALTGYALGSPVDRETTSPLLGGLVAFVTTARLLSRPRWNLITALIIVSSALVTTASGAITVAAQGLSILIGIVVGLLARYALGTPTTRPSGADVAATLIAGDIPLVMLRAKGGTESGRQYMAVTNSGEQLDVVVLDRDLEGSNLLGALWRSIRLRETNDATTGLSMRATLERTAMMAYAAEASGAPTPQLRMSAMVNADAALLAYDSIEGRVVGQGTQTDRPTDQELDAAWAAVALLQRRYIAHQALSAENVRYAGENTYLTGLEAGTIAAGDVTLRLDIAEMLVTQSVQTDVPTAIASARRVLGDDAVLRALPVLQRVALSGPTRAALRGQKELLGELREGLLAINPRLELEPVDLERLKPRTVFTLILGTVAAYLLLSQLAQVDVVEVVSQADWRWAGVALVLSLVTYIGATFALLGFIPDRISFVRTLQAQFAASFATLVSPPTLGAVAVNARYLNRAGLPPAAAAATVGVSQVGAFIVHVTLMLVIGIAAGTQADLTFDPPRAVVIGIGIVAMIIGGLASISHVRRWLSNRIRPMIDQVIPRLATVAQRPAKLAEGFGGILMLNLAYCLCLVASVRAFSDSLTVAAISFVYLAGSTLGQAAPTPGGLGVVEAALAAGLTAAGMDSALAVSATLLFRTVTFWLPTIPGWFGFRDLTKRGLL